MAYLLICLYAVALLLTLGFVTQIILWILPILPNLLLVIFMGLSLGALIGITLSIIELIQVNKKKEKLVYRKQLKAGLGIVYFLMVYLVGMDLKVDVQKEENYNWTEQGARELASFDDTKNIFLKETADGYQVLIKHEEKAQEVRAFKYQEIEITEREEAIPMIQIIDGTSNTWLEQLLGESKKRDKHLGVKVKAQLLLPISQESYFAHAE